MKLSCISPTPVGRMEIILVPEQGADLSLKDEDGNSVLHAVVQQTKTAPESTDALLQVNIVKFINLVHRFNSLSKWLPKCSSVQ